MSKKRIALFFGGQSTEHEVSCVSAVTIAEALDPALYDVELIGITKNGRWLAVPNTEAIRSGAWKDSKVSVLLAPDAGARTLIKYGEDGVYQTEVIDVAFPALHGRFGEDGTIQGLFELAGIPYVGCGVIASAISMDKWYTKQVVDHLGIRQADYVGVKKEEFEQDMDAVLDRVEAKLPYPVFVKPCNSGSSCGISKAKNREELAAALRFAGGHDRKILVEEAIIGRELECAVFGTYKGEASGIGEILAAADFYDYDAKYNNPESMTVIDPEVPEGVREEIRADAVKIFEAVDGFGLARVDFFYDTQAGEVVFNEINTLPGFTGISMYPMLQEAYGRDRRSLVGALVEMADQR